MNTQSALSLATHLSVHACKWPQTRVPLRDVSRWMINHFYFGSVGCFRANSPSSIVTTASGAKSGSGWGGGGYHPIGGGRAGVFFYHGNIIYFSPDSQEHWSLFSVLLHVYIEHFLQQIIYFKNTPATPLPSKTWMMASLSTTECKVDRGINMAKVALGGSCFSSCL